MMKKKYHWGILGPGRIARKFASDLCLLPDAVIHAVGSLNRERAEVFATEFNIPNVYDSYDRVATDPKIDIVYIATLHPAHYRNALLCIQHGKHVLCEKPAAMNRHQLERILVAAHEQGVFFMEALWTRFVPSCVKCWECVRSGMIGELRLIEADFCIHPPYSPNSRLFNPYLGGGSLLDIGIYPVFLALETGTPVTEIKARAILDSNHIDQICTVLMSHEQGVQSILCSSSITNGRNEALLHGTKGMLRLNRFWHTPTTLDFIPDSGEPYHFDFEKQGYGYQYEALEVMHCLDNEKHESPLWSWDKSRRLHLTLDRIRECTGICYPDNMERV